jgi:surface polysaccharide O-acyltransferase-like enzyme
VRLIPPTIFWNLVYLGLYVLDGMDTQTILWTLKAQIIVDGYVAPHLWYLSMFACLMIFAPFINKFIIGEKPTARDLAVLLGLTFPFFLLNTVASMAINIYDLTMDWFKIFPWFIVYFITGFYIDNYSAKIPLKNSLILIAIIALTAIGAGLNYYAASSLGIVKDYFIVTERGPLVFIISLLIFLLGRNLSSVLVENKFVLAVAEASLGIYLIHEIFNGVFHKILPDYYSHGLIYIPGVTMLTFILSFISIRLLHKIPFMKAVC